MSNLKTISDDLNRLSQGGDLSETQINEINRIQQKLQLILEENEKKMKTLLGIKTNIEHFETDHPVLTDLTSRVLTILMDMGI